MKTFFVRLLCALTLISSLPTQAAGASDEYVSIYSLITKGDEMLSSGLSGEAAQFYSDAHRKLVAFRRAYPGWNEQVIRFRLKYLGEKLADLPAIVVDPVASRPVESAPVKPDGSPDLASRNQLLEGQVAALNEQMRQLSADNSLLLKKLRESMAARPAEVDPSQVRKAEAKILELEKENELIELQLRRALDTKPAAPVAPQNPDRALQKELEQMRARNSDLQKRLSDLDAEAKLASDRSANLERELKAALKQRDELQRGQAKQAQNTNQGELQRLSQEVTSLRQQLVLANQSLAAAKANPPASPSVSVNHPDDGRETIEELMRENALLRRQVETSSSSELPTGDADERLSKKIASLEKQNQDLADKLAKARRSDDRGRLGWLPRIGRRGDRNLSVLEARLAVLEAEKEPYSAEELALLQGGEVDGDEATESVALQNAPSGEMAQAAATLEAAAQEAARRGDYAAAESKYDEILDLIPNHAPSLASLALTQIKQQKKGEAEANLEMALEIAPENTYALFLSGLLRMSQNRFDDAVTFLSRATVLDPDDAEAQNHLGIALMEVGHRSAAEAALRKAIRLRPGYPDAHVNLAVVYASQDPPFKELAKYHYQQAVNAGHPADPQIEQLINRN